MGQRTSKATTGATEQNMLHPHKGMRATQETPLFVTLSSLAWRKWSRRVKWKKHDTYLNLHTASSNKACRRRAHTHKHQSIFILAKFALLVFSTFFILLCANWAFLTGKCLRVFGINNFFTWLDLSPGHAFWLKRDPSRDPKAGA